MRECARSGFAITDEHCAAIQGSVKKDDILCLNCKNKVKVADDTEYRKETICIKLGCSEPVHAKGLCRKHYQNDWNGRRNSGE